MALNSEQIRNAQTIISVGRGLGASRRDIMIALMAASVESDLINVSHGHLDSIGLFQQRNAWGSRSARMNPRESARMFFQGGRGGQPGLFDNSRRGSMNPGAAAQWVQRSAFPDRYAQRQGIAQQLLGMSGGGGGGTSNTSGRFLRPVADGRITQRFGDPAPRGVTYARGYKNGMSFAAAHGSAVMASARGKVVAVGSAGAYGNRVEIEHGGKVWTLYAHLSSVSVSPGDVVEAGQVVGRVGATGQAYGSHLHFELRRGKNNYYNAVNPQDFLSGNTTPRGYVQDVTTYMDPLENPALFGMADPMATMLESKPYVYVSPFERMQPMTPGIGEESLGGLIDDGEDTITDDFSYTDPEAEETEATGPQEDVETRVPEGAV